MRGKALKDLSFNSFQLIINQAFGLIVFYVLSASLDKNSFGKINLALAILLAVFNILSLGIDQLTVRKIAVGNNPQTLLTTYLSHVVMAGLLFYGLLILANCIIPNQFEPYKLLLVIGIGKLFIFFSTPFKQFAAGFEKFKLLAWMSITSNVIRGCALLVLALFHAVTLYSVIVVFITGDIAELLFSIALFKLGLKVPVSVKWNKTDYSALLREAIPQAGVVVFTSALARFDWIFIGIFVSAVKLAEYSFAYKIFELSTLPLLAIAPMLVPRFTKIFRSDNHYMDELRFILKLEMIISSFIIILLNICWVPVIDILTANKYGAINSQTIFILSLAMPLMYLNNFLWSINFAKGHLKIILGVIGLTFLVNLSGDILLIPFFKNEGAAIAYLVAMMVQAAAYIKKGEFAAGTVAYYPLFICTFCALSSIFVAHKFFSNTAIALSVAILLFIILLFLTRQLRRADRSTLVRILA